MQVHREHPIGSSGFDEIGNQLRANGVSRLVFSVLPRVSVIGDHGGDRACRRALERVDHHEELHQVGVGGRARGLNHITLRAPDGLAHLEVDLTVLKAPDDGVAHRDAEPIGDFMGEFGVGRPGEESNL